MVSARALGMQAPPGGGEVGALMRKHDWSTSALGAPETWPQALRLVVSLLLGSKFPMFVAWGRELAFLYNDAYAEILGEKHPAALGRRFDDIWSEIWDDVRPLVAAAMRGEATYREDLPLTMNRRGYDEETWFTFSYSPVHDEAGQVAGMFCAVTETTARVRSERRQAFLFQLDEQLGNLDQADEMFDAAARSLGDYLQADRVHWAEIDAPQGSYRVSHEWTRAETPPLAGLHPLSDFGDDLIGQMRAGHTVEASDIQAHAPSPLVGGAAAVGDLVRGAIAAPLFRSNQWRMALCVHTLKPRRWQEGDADLVREAAQRAWTRAERTHAEERVTESESRFRALVDATSDVVFRMSPDWSEMRRLYGRGLLGDTDQPSVTWRDTYLLSEDLPAISDAVAEAIASKSAFQLEHRVRQIDGKVGWTLSRAIPVLDPQGEIAEWFGTASDITEARASRAALEHSAERLQLATDAAEVGLWDLDPVAEVLYWPPRVKQMFGISPDAEASMQDFYAGLHPDDRERVTAGFAAAMDPDLRALYDAEYRTIGKEDGKLRWVAAKGRGLFDAEGRCIRVVGTAIDISARKAAEEHMRLMVNELNHRVKNSLATVQAIAAHTLRRGEVPNEVREALVARLIALASAHDVLTDQRWTGADLGGLIRDTASPYAGVDGASSFRIVGPTVFLPPRTAIALSLAFHELATNAAKYGALRAPGGRVEILWTIEDESRGRRLRLTWRESGGPPVAQPTRTGFGFRLIRRALTPEQGEVTLDYEPAGLVCTMDTLLPQEVAEDWTVDLQLI